ncbi:MAG: hypothetical protein LBE34_02790 [Flavobacteriaceae bacterium]|nr:hypothetical protein [Flavobacteriaceae bacterium]
MSSGEEIKLNTSEATPCSSCGGPMTYKPSAHALVCEYCGSIKEIEQTKDELNELDFMGFMESYEKESFNTTKVVECSSCHATSTVDENLKSMACPYCANPLVEQDIHEERYIKPEYVAPFAVEKTQVAEILQGWIKGLWFAPNKIQRGIFSADNLRGVYVPFWTYDMQTYTQYRGERGDAYYVTVGSGDNKRRERRISWSSVRGTVSNFYDDILVTGSKTLKMDLLNSISTGWDPKAVQKIKPDYLSGFITEKYQVDLKEGYDRARDIVTQYERESVKRDIGGDEQRVDDMNTELSEITFKHILLPLYISSFSFGNKQYTFYVNGVTGRITGERPYSPWKIAFACFIGLLVLIFLIYLFKNA